MQMAQSSPGAAKSTRKMPKYDRLVPSEEFNSLNWWVPAAFHFSASWAVISLRFPLRCRKFRHGRRPGGRAVSTIPSRFRWSRFLHRDRGNPGAQLQPGGVVVYFPLFSPSSCRRGWYFAATVGGVCLGGSAGILLVDLLRLALRAHLPVGILMYGKR